MSLGGPAVRAWSAPGGAPPPASTPLSLVQVIQDARTAAGGQVLFPEPAAIGHFVVLIVASLGHVTGAHLATPTGAALTEVASTTLGPTTGIATGLSMWLSPALTAASGGVDFTLSGTTSDWTATMLEIQSPGPLTVDQVSTNHAATATSFTANAVTTTHATELLIGAVGTFQFPVTSTTPVSVIVIATRYGPTATRRVLPGSFLMRVAVAVSNKVPIGPYPFNGTFATSTGGLTPLATTYGALLVSLYG